MKIFLCWNCSELGSPEAVLSLTDLIHTLDIVFLCETKQWASEMTKIREKLHFDHGVWVDAIGRSGGSALFRTNDVD